MKETSSETPNINGSRFTPNAVVTDSTTSSSHQTQDLNLNNNENNFTNSPNGIPGNDGGLDEKSSVINGFNAPVTTTSGQFPPAMSTQVERSGPVVESPSKAEEQTTTTTPEPKKKRSIIDEIRRNGRLAVTYSWLNALLIFVPIGIIVASIDGIHGGIVFGMNAVAIIPLAGLLAFATESVAREMGDALGALLNVTFGNAVELIIFIALVKNEIRIVQASLLGSILANLLLILGMGFFLGGLRYREQIYNSTVTQMSACLLSLSVISLVLPTAFHASFSDTKLADAQSLKISRGTSVILLLVYLVYLLFQLKSHAYMYESTPQHIVDAESTPGPAAAWLDSSSSDDSSSSSSSSDDSDHSQGTMRKKMKKVLRSRRRRKSTASSTDTNNTKATGTASFVASRENEAVSEASNSRPKFPRFPSVEGSEEAVEDEEPRRHHKRRHRRHRYRKSKKNALDEDNEDSILAEPKVKFDSNARAGGDGEPRRVDFAVQNEDQTENLEIDSGAEGSGRLPFPILRGISIKNLTPTVFGQNPKTGIAPPVPHGHVPRVRYGIRRTNSLPDRLNQHQFRPPGAMLPAQIPLMALSAGTDPVNEDDEEKHLSRAGSVVLLLVSTALVAVCAEFLVGSIEEVVATSSIGEIFIGLIILPIVGNAAEHVTAVTVAMKNKMDLAIGVAVGSSIQIALFITPLVVILGWIMDREMTLYFTLFETVCLFVSAFIVNFLVLDGRSNYLEGALLCAVYLIISVVAFYYPDEDQASSWGA